VKSDIIDLQVLLLKTKLELSKIYANVKKLRMKEKIWILILGVLSIFYCSCKSSINAKIEMRERMCDNISDANSVYIVNTSKTRKLKFTVRETEIINDTTKNYSTSHIELEPGDEKYLGCDKKYGSENYKEFGLVIIIDTIIYAKASGTTSERKFYCTRDTSILNYMFDHVFIFKSDIVDTSEVAKYALEERKMTLKELLPETKLFIGIPEGSLVINENLTQRSKSLKAILKCFDPRVQLKKDVYVYKFEVTGQMDDKRIKRND
jgi:hypothetical protein